MIDATALNTVKRGVMLENCARGGQGEEVAVWKIDGKLHAIANRCPHKQAKLSMGDIEDLGAGPAVRCPKHRGKFAGGLYFNL